MRSSGPRVNQHTTQTTTGRDEEGETKRFGSIIMTNLKCFDWFV